MTEHAQHQAPTTTGGAAGTRTDATGTGVTGTDVIETDVVVVGGGPVGENVAQYAHDGGLEVVLVEQGLVGGECSYHACIPSKALLRPVQLAHTSTRLPGVSPAVLQSAELLERRDDWVSHYDDAGQADWVTGAGMQLVRGRGRVSGEREVSVDGRVLRARRAVVLATGSRPVVPDLYAGVHPWTSADATGVVEVPHSIAVIGGGVVAVEAATWLTGLGSHVTVIARGTLLSHFEQGVGDAVREGLVGLGVDVRTGTEVGACTREDAADTGLGRVHGGRVHLTAGGSELTVDEVLVVLGRTPARDDLGLESVGLEAADIDEGRLPEWLHVIGDAGADARLTHMGKYEGRVLGSRLAGVQEFVPEDAAPVPQVVFGEPQVAQVGRTEHEAREAGIDVVTTRVSIDAAAGVGLAEEQASGFAQLVVDRATGILVGATFVGPDVAELVHGATIAIVGRVPVRVLRHAVPSFPTASELWLRLLEQLPAELRR